ncbi:hypothetical protein C8F01DRAFT_1091138 [Mycena amicta]|nr:hypothetical protein C8F01DRAFT_1091138 [Mycena amicta]
MSPTLTHSAPWPPGSPATQRIPSGAERSTESMSRSDWVDGGFTYEVELQDLRLGLRVSAATTIRLVGRSWMTAAGVRGRPGQLQPDPSLSCRYGPTQRMTLRYFISTRLRLLAIRACFLPRDNTVPDARKSCYRVWMAGARMHLGHPRKRISPIGTRGWARGRHHIVGEDDHRFHEPPAFTHVKRTYVSDWQLTDGILQELGSDSPTARCVSRQKPRLPLAATFEGRVDSVFSRLDAISSLIRVSQSLRIVSIVADDSLTDLRVLHTFRAFRCRTHEGTYLTSSRLLSRLDSYDPLTTTDADYRILVGVDGAVSRAADGWQTTNGSYTRGTRRSPLPQGLGPQAHHHRPCPVSAAFDQKSLTKTMHKNRQTRVLLDNAPAHVGIPRGSKKAHTGVLVVGASRPAVLVLQELPRIHNAPWTKRPISKSTASRPDVVDGRAVYIDETTLSLAYWPRLPRIPRRLSVTCVEWIIPPRDTTPPMGKMVFKSSLGSVGPGTQGRKRTSIRCDAPCTPNGPASQSSYREVMLAERVCEQLGKGKVWRAARDRPAKLRRPARSTVTVSVRRRYIDADAKEVEVESQGEGEVWLPSKLVFIYCAALASKAAGPQFTKEKRYPILVVEWLSKSSLQELSVRFPFQGPRDLPFRLRPICAPGRCTSSHRGRSSESGDGWWAAASRWHNRVLDAMLPELHAAPNPSQSSPSPASRAAPLSRSAGIIPSQPAGYRRPSGKTSLGGLP